MKRVLCILTLLLFGWACNDDDKPVVPGPGDFFLNLSSESVLVNDTLTYVKVTVETNGEYWDVQGDTTAVWCEPSMNDVPSDRSVTLKIGQNPDADDRQAVITVFGEDDITKTITVKQMGTAPAILFYADNLDKLADDSLTIRIDIRANMEYEVIVPEQYRTWISWLGQDEVDPVRNFFGINRNLGELRDGEILLRGVLYPEVQRVINLRQLSYEAVYLPSDPSGIGVIRDIQLKVQTATATSAQSGEGIERSYDGSLSTFYHSNWSGGHMPITLIFTLREAADIDFINYYGRPSGTNGNLGEFELSYSKNTSGDDWITVGEYNFGSASTTAVTRSIVLDNPLEQAKRVRYVISSGVGGHASCAEMEFWQYAPEDLRLPTVFTDETYSALNPGVTYSMIAALQEDYPFRFNIAKHLLNGDYPTDDRVHLCNVYRHPDKVATELKTARYSRLDNATGIFINAMEEVAVFVGPTNGATVLLYVVNPLDGGIQVTSHDLKAGENLITSTQAGLAYIGYYSESGTLPDLKVHIASGQVNGRFDVRKHTDSDWPAILANSTYPMLDVVGKKMHLLFPVDNWKAVSSPTELIGVWDEIVTLQHRLLGFEKYMIWQPKNRMFGFADMNPDASYMYAGDYQTGYSPSTHAGVLDVARLRTDWIWGPAHELGHVNQVRPAMKWQGMTEVTNNIYSMYVQTQFGNTSRLYADGVYGQAYNEIIVKKRPHITNDVFQMLVPFWQIQLYAEAIGKENDLYPDIFEKARASSQTDDGKCQLNYVSWCSELLGLDMTEFFTAWGFLRPISITITDYSEKPVTVLQEDIDAVIAEMSARPAAPGGLIYLTDGNKAYMKNKTGVSINSATRTGLNYAIEASGAMAFKVYDPSDELVYIASGGTFRLPAGTVAGRVTAVQWDGMEIEVNF